MKMSDEQRKTLHKGIQELQRAYEAMPPERQKQRAEYAAAKAIAKYGIDIVEAACKKYKLDHAAGVAPWLPMDFFLDGPIDLNKYLTHDLRNAIN
jgi:hypothetical protein